MGQATGAGDGTAGGPQECFESPECDPLSSECPGTELCISEGSVFRCVAPLEGTEMVGLGDACDGPLACQGGLACLSVPVTGCSGAPGCCVALCELDAAQCPAGTDCTPLNSDPSPSCYDNVGVCIEV